MKIRIKAKMMIPIKQKSAQTKTIINLKNTWTRRHVRHEYLSDAELHDTVGHGHGGGTTVGVAAHAIPAVRVAPAPQRNAVVVKGVHCGCVCCAADPDAVNCVERVHLELTRRGGKV